MHDRHTRDLLACQGAHTAIGLARIAVATAITHMGSHPEQEEALDKIDALLRTVMIQVARQGDL